MSAERSDAIVLFGASGDLAKKMTFVSLYHLAERGLLDMPIIGVAFSDCNDIGALVQFRVARNLTDAAALALSSGVDLDLQCGRHCPGC